MSGPARAGFFVYAADLSRVATFYERVLDMRRVQAREDIVILASPDMQLIVHAIPPEFAVDITIEAPPVRRADAAYKFFATVPRLDAAAEAAAGAGGRMFDERWQGRGFVACNVMDPEGNVFQLREFDAA